MEISVRLQVFKPHCRSRVAARFYTTLYCWKPSSVFLPFWSSVQHFIRLTAGECFTCLTCSHYCIQVSLNVSTLCWVWEAWLIRREGVSCVHVQGAAGWLRGSTLRPGAVWFLLLFLLLDSWLLLPRRTSQLSVQILNQFLFLHKQPNKFFTDECLRKAGSEEKTNFRRHRNL